MSVKQGIKLGFVLIAIALNSQNARAHGGSQTVRGNLDSRDYSLSVSSAHGTPIPGVGTTLYAWRSSVTCSVDYDVSEGGTNYTCSGWKGSGAIPVSGSTHYTGAIVLTHVASSIAWQWAAPSVTTLAANETTDTSATLNGTVNANGAAATVYFEYGLTTAYGSTASVTLSPANGTTSKAVRKNISGLQAGSTYHYRLTANNRYGTTSGSNRTFVANEVICNLTTNGAGTVTRSPAGLPEIGKTYTLTATPKTGFGFKEWTGSVTGTNKVQTFIMSANMTITGNFTDIIKPTIKITAPTAAQKIFAANGLFTVRGTAIDNGTLGSVLVKVNNGSWTGAGTTNALKNWSTPVTLTAGTNTILAYGMDTAGNHSLTSRVTCVYTETGALNIITNGPGKVTVSPAGPLLLGRTYTLTAAAGAGGIFSNWTGDVMSTGKVIRVTLDVSNKTRTVSANFTDIMKPTVKITYPTASMKVMTNGTVILRGTAADNGTLGGVKYQLYSGEWTNAASTNNLFKNWTAAYEPVPGLNTSKVYSVDVQGNISATSTVVFTYLPGAIMTVQTNGQGTISPAYNGKVLQIGKTNLMTATAKTGYVFTNWTYGVGGAVATNARAVKFVMQSNLVLTANFRNLSAPVSAAAPAGLITVDGAIEDWTGISRSTFSYDSVTQEVAAAISGNNIALLLTGCPFDVSDTVLVYFKLRLTYGDGDNRHTLDLWTSGSELYAMVDGQTVTGLEAVLSNGVLEVKLPVEQTPSQVTIEEVSCGMDPGDGTLTDLFSVKPNER